MANYSDTEIQKFFEDAERKAEAWGMPTDTSNAETDSIIDEFFVEASQKDSETSESAQTEDMNMHSEDNEYDEAGSEGSVSPEPTEKPEESNIMSQEEIEAMIKSGPSNEDSPTESQAVTMDMKSEKSLDTQPQEKLSSSQIEDMFDQQSSSIPIPESEEQSKVEESSSDEVTKDTPDIADTADDNNYPANESEIDVTSESQDSHVSSKSVENSASDDLEASIKRKKIEQQLAKADLKEMDIAALFNKNNDNPSDPTSVLSQDDFRHNIQILDNQSNVINSDDVLESLLLKQGIREQPSNTDDGILSNEEVSQMLHANVNDSAEPFKHDPFKSNNSSQATNPSSSEPNQQFERANNAEKAVNKSKSKKWVTPFAIGSLLLLGTIILILMPEIRKHLAPKVEEFVNPATSWSWEKNQNPRSSVKYKIFTSGMSLMLSNISGAISSDINKLNTDMIKKVYENQVTSKKIKTFKILNEAQYMREAGDALRMIHFDYAIQTNDNRAFLKKSVYLGVGERLLKLDFTARTDNIDEPSDGPNWSRLENNFRAALGLGELTRNREVYLGQQFENFDKSSRYFAARALGLNP